MAVLPADATEDAGKSISPDSRDLKGGNRNGYCGFGTGFEDDIPGLPLSVTDNPLDAELGLPNILTNRNNRINWTSSGRSGDGRSHPVDQPLFASFQYSPAVQKAIESILYIADHIKKEDDDNNVSQYTHLL